MTDTPEMKLARALKAAAQEYCRETGRTFDPRFEFVEITSMHDKTLRFSVASVTISHTEETRA